MTDLNIRATVAHVIDTHRERNAAPASMSECQCGYVEPVPWVDHMADVIIAALGLALPSPPPDANANIGRRIRHTNPDGFRARLNGPFCWATVLAIVTTESGRDAYVVRFGDGVADLWSVEDPSDPYDFEDIPAEPPPPRFVVLSIDSERFEYRSRHLVVDVAKREAVAECDVRANADRVAAALELQPEPPNWNAPDLEPF